MCCFRPALSALLVLLTSACAGFAPLYGENSAAQKTFARLSVAPVDGRAGFLFTQALQERGGIRPGQSGAYVLQTDLEESRVLSGVRTDQVATRARLTVTARYTLVGRDGTAVYRGTAQSTAAFDDPGQPYAALAAEQDATEKAMRALAEKVLNDLAAFFNTQAQNP